MGTRHICFYRDVDRSEVPCFKSWDVFTGLRRATMVSGIGSLGRCWVEAAAVNYLADGADVLLRQSLILRRRYASPIYSSHGSTPRPLAGLQI